MAFKPCARAGISARRHCCTSCVCLRRAISLLCVSEAVWHLPYIVQTNYGRVFWSPPQRARCLFLSDLSIPVALWGGAAGTDGVKGLSRREAFEQPIVSLLLSHPSGPLRRGGGAADGAGRWDPRAGGGLGLCPETCSSTRPCSRRKPSFWLVAVLLPTYFENALKRSLGNWKIDH